MTDRYGDDRQFWTTHVARSGPGAGDVPWKALTVVAYPSDAGVWLSVRARSGRGGNHADRVVLSGRLDLGLAPDNDDMGPLLKAISDALAAASDNF